MERSGTFIADGGAINVDLGFIPDYVKLFSALGGTVLGLEWYRVLADAGAAGQYGIAYANLGGLSVAGDGANGIIPYDESKNDLVMVESPKPGVGKIKVPVADWTLSTAVTGRTATAPGTVVRPTTHNGRVYECTTGGTTGATEPTSWPTTPGATVTDNTAVWTCREEETVRGGGKGFTVGATISLASDVWVFKAETHDKMLDHGDAADKDPI